MIFIFLTSGLFLGWSLGANDAANVFGTAVGTRMIRFKTAALIAAFFVIVGAVVGGSGGAHTLGKLGAVNALAGSFTVALGAAFTVFMMTKFKLPVSSSQAIVGAIIGWNFFSGAYTDYNTLSRIVSTWILCPLLSALIAVILFKAVELFLSKIKLHLLKEDNYVRWGLILVGAFGSYSLGANNIANVMGVFVSSIPFEPLDVYGLFTLSGAQQLFLLGGVAIAVGIYTYSYKVMDTIGSGLMKLSPVAALVVVLAQSTVLFIFSSVQLENWLLNHNLPSFPLVPVSSSQAVIGAILGIGIAKGGKGIKFGVLGGISGGWVTTPVIAGIITFVGLFFMQNVFAQQVSKKVEYKVTPEVVSYLGNRQIADESLKEVMGKSFSNAFDFSDKLKEDSLLTDKQIVSIVKAATVFPLKIDSNKVNDDVDTQWFAPEQITALKKLHGATFDYKWQMAGELARESKSWQFKEENKVNHLFNKDMQNKLDYLYSLFKNEN